MTINYEIKSDSLLGSSLQNNSDIVRPKTLFTRESPQKTVLWSLTLVNIGSFDFCNLDALKKYLEAGRLNDSIYSIFDIQFL